MFIFILQVSWYAVGCYYLLQPKKQELTRRYLLKTTMIDKVQFLMDFYFAYYSGRCFYSIISLLDVWSSVACPGPFLCTGGRTWSSYGSIFHSNSVNERVRNLSMYHIYSKCLNRFDQHRLIFNQTYPLLKLKAIRPFPLDWANKIFTLP